MDISSVYGKCYSAYIQNTKKTTSKADASGMQEEQSMAEFKKEFYNDLEKITINSSIEDVTINISEKAFENMKADPEYREKILSLLQRDLGAYYGSGPRRACLLMNVGATLNDYRGDSWPICNNSEYHARTSSGDSFFKKSREKSDRSDEILERYLEKREETKALQEKLWKDKAAKQKLEHRRLMKSSQALAAYEAVME